MPKTSLSTVIEPPATPYCRFGAKNLAGRGQKGVWAGREVRSQQRIVGGEEEINMVTWVLVEEPTPEVASAIEVVEARLGSTEEVMWVCPGPVVEPVQD